MDVPEILRALEKLGTKRDRDGMARYGIVAPRAYGVSVAKLRVLAKQVGRDHAVALELWKTGWYEARMLCGFIDEPARVTPAQMDRWCKDFDNWAVCDHLCFHLFDRTPHAFAKIAQWAPREEEFVRRAAFALLASVALHDKTLGDAPFLRALPLIAGAADDQRNFVKKGVIWAEKAIARRNPTLAKAVRDLRAKRPAPRSGRSPRRGRSPSASA